MVIQKVSFSLLLFIEKRRREAIKKKPTRYKLVFYSKERGERRGSNPRPSEPQSDALTNWATFTIFEMRCKDSVIFWLYKFRQALFYKKTYLFLNFSTFKFHQIYKIRNESNSWRCFTTALSILIYLWSIEATPAWRHVGYKHKQKLLRPVRVPAERTFLWE